MPEALNLQKIHQLARDLDNPGIAFRFLGDYLSLLPQRLERILTALADEDGEAAMDSVLSLKITSAMIGAHEPDNTCRALEASLKNGDFKLARVLSRTLVDTVAALTDLSPELLRSAQCALGLGEEAAGGRAAA
jgi:HPt (histidine-containing phosphotransfer) domain-containing protein